MTGISELRRPRWARRRGRLQPGGVASLHERLVTCDVGLLAVPPDDTVVGPWLAEYGTWEEAEASVLRAWLRPGMTFVDVGAHVGYFTLLGAQVVGPGGCVIAVEPDVENYSLLVRNLRRHPHRNVATVNAAAWHRSGEVTLKRSPEHNSGDHRVREHFDGVAPRVRAARLDELLDRNQRIDVIKIDTQGTDHRVIEGARSIIERWRPRMVVEFWPPGIEDIDPAALADFYRSLEYRITALEAPALPEDATGPALVTAAAAAEHGFLTLLLEC